MDCDSGLFLALPVACVISVAAYTGSHGRSPPMRCSRGSVRCRGVRSVDLTLALLPLASIRPWLKAALAVLSVPYSMLAFAAGELFIGCALGNCL